MRDSPVRAARPGSAVPVTLWRWLAIALLLQVSGAAGKAGKKSKQPLPVAVEAGFKERITAKLEDALAASAAHLARALDVVPGQTSRDEREGSFGPGYELDLRLASSAGAWRERCEADIAVERDSVRHCAIHKLQALTALCEVPGAAAQYRAGIMRLLHQLLGPRDAIIEGLGVKRVLLPIGTGMEAWLAEAVSGDGNFDVAVTVHAAAMLTMVQCGSSLGEQGLMAEIQSWFAALEKAFPRSSWNQQSFHANAIMWESFVVILTKLPKGSSFAEDVRDLVRDLETYLSAQFEKQPQAWSFSGARAVVLSWLDEAKPKRRRALGKTIDEYLRRWKELAPSVRVNEAYTCGPLQGVPLLLLRRGEEAAALVSSVLKMAEKDIDLFQLRLGRAESPASERLGGEVLAAHGAALDGAFFRDDAQLKGEGRRSIRIDDTAQCVLGLARSLQLLSDLQGVAVPAEAGGGTSGAEQLQRQQPQQQPPADEL